MEKFAEKFIEKTTILEASDKDKAEFKEFLYVTKEVEKLLKRISKEVSYYSKECVVDYKDQGKFNSFYSLDMGRLFEALDTANMNYPG